MQVMFTGNPRDEKDGSGGVDFYGLRFALNKPVDVSHLTPAQQGKLRGNSHFTVVEDAAPATVAPAPVAARSAPRIVKAAKA